MTLPAMSDSLAGRIEMHHLWPLSQEEINGKKSGFLDILLSPDGKFPDKDCSWEQLVENMIIGGYPEALKRDTEIRRDKWFASYITAILQKDIKDLSNIAVPLTRLTRNAVTFSWGPEQQTSFETLRQKLCEAPVLALPEGMEDFVVYCDASISGLGAVLMQRGHVIA